MSRGYSMTLEEAYRLFGIKEGNRLQDFLRQNPDMPELLAVDRWRRDVLAGAVGRMYAELVGARGVDEGDLIRASDRFETAHEILKNLTPA